MEKLENNKTAHMEIFRFINLKIDITFYILTGFCFALFLFSFYESL